MQEPGTHEEILEFVQKFDEKMTEKLVFFEKGYVNGAETRPVFSYLKQKLPNSDGSSDVRWNFGTFLQVSGRGKVAHRSFSQVSR